MHSHQLIPDTITCDVNLVASSTLLHVLLERRGIWDGLAGILVLDLLGKVTSVVLTSHGPAKLSGFVPVDLLASNTGGEGRLGRGGEGGGRGNKGSEYNKLVLHKEGRASVK